MRTALLSSLPALHPSCSMLDFDSSVRPPAFSAKITLTMFVVAPLVVVFLLCSRPGP